MLVLGASIVFIQAAPRPAAEADTGRVLVDVGDHLVQVALVGDHARLEPVLEQVPAPVVAAVETDRVEAVQALHPA
jgi:hypothetical protein